MGKKKKSRESNMTSEELNNLDLEALCNYIENKNNKNNSKQRAAKQKEEAFDN